MIAADLIHRVSNADADGEGAVDVSLAIAYGLNLGAKAQPLLAQRWEEGGRTPLDHWREGYVFVRFSMPARFQCRRVRPSVNEVEFILRFAVVFPRGG